MSYAAPTDVEALFRKLSTTKTDTAVTTAKIQDWLDNASAMIDARIGKLYRLPITSGSNPQSFKILKQIEAFMVAGIVDDILNTYTQADKKPMWEKRASLILDSYAPEDCKKDCEPASLLPDAEYLGTSVQKGTFKANNTTSDPIFKKGANNW